MGRIAIPFQGWGEGQTDRKDVVYWEGRLQLQEIKYFLAVFCSLEQNRGNESLGCDSNALESIWILPLVLMKCEIRWIVNDLLLHIDLIYKNVLLPCAKGTAATILQGPLNSPGPSSIHNENEFFHQRRAIKLTEVQLILFS